MRAMSISSSYAMGSTQQTTVLNRDGERKIGQSKKHSGLADLYISSLNSQSLPKLQNTTQSRDAINKPPAIAPRPGLDVTVENMDVDAVETPDENGIAGVSDTTDKMRIAKAEDQVTLSNPARSQPYDNGNSSALSDLSDLSSPPPSPPLSSKATTPTDLEMLKESVTEPAPQHQVTTPPQPAPGPQLVTQTNPIIPSEPTGPLPSGMPLFSSLPKGPARPAKRRKFDVPPRSSIPTDLAAKDYANQCIAAAESSRLNPFALHTDEYTILKDHISLSQVTTYLNIRNGILRLWINNPRIAVTREEAVGCAKDVRWFEAASVCFDWLSRSGYINFGCVDFANRDPNLRKPSPKKKKPKTVLVLGAGMSGLGCARQLDSLFTQYATEFLERGEEPPRVIVLEGRNRLGGRVYSRGIEKGRCQPTPGFEGNRYTVECGGMIITGFERGNPINVLLRGQMGLPYYALRSDATLYDSNGKPVDESRDQLVEKLYNDCLDRVSEYKFKVPPSKLIEGNRDLMELGKDPRDHSGESQKTIASLEIDAANRHQQPLPVEKQNLAKPVSLVPVSTDRATGKTHMEPGTPAAHAAAEKAQLMGWVLKPGVSKTKSLGLDEAAHADTATLGSVMDEAITQCKDLVDLTPLDFRLMNWHVANLEYSNAINYNQLSIKGWDIDAGNEWEGKHTMVVGGYQNVPWGLGNAPSRLDIRKNTEVRKIHYDPELDGKSKARVECEDGTVFEADHVVSTIPLGVLKHGPLAFEPPLPAWKQGAIDRLGFGTLNKIILVYEQAFWDQDRDIFGALRAPHARSLKQTDYQSQRGRCFQWFNVSNTSGLPVLLGLMAGDAGAATEGSQNDDLVAEATQVLKSIYGAKVPAQPVHSIITRWASDRFARGSYSSAGPDMKFDDYQVMAHRVGNLFFAGEHTSGTHPATVHGAYLSGLRAASEVLDDMLGPIPIPSPLVQQRSSHHRRSTGSGSMGAAAAPSPSPRNTKHAAATAGSPAMTPAGVPKRKPTTSDSAVSPGSPRSAKQMRIDKAATHARRTSLSLSSSSSQTSHQRPSLPTLAPRRRDS